MHKGLFEVGCLAAAKAEIEIMALHGKLDHIRVEHLEQIARTQQEQLQRLTELCETRGLAP
jgi:uncharacterized membrane protein